ncbi:MAG: lipocalin family protein [Bacteroidota bacterium]
MRGFIYSFSFLACIAASSCGSESHKIIGRWTKVKEVLANGSVIDQNSPYNYYKNYTVDFRSDNKVYISFDTDQSSGTTKQNEDQGEWRLEKSDSAGFLYNLTVRITDRNESRETVNQVKTLSDNELVLVSKDGHMVYFTRK